MNDDARQGDKKQREEVYSLVRIRLHTAIVNGAPNRSLLEDAEAEIVRLERELADAAEELRAVLLAPRRVAPSNVAPGTAMEALESAIKSHGEGDLGGWELDLVRRRLLAERSSVAPRTDLETRLRAAAADKDLTVKVISGDHRVVVPVALVNEAADALAAHSATASRTNELPSRFQLGAKVRARGVTGLISGICFREGKVYYEVGGIMYGSEEVTEPLSVVDGNSNG